jgi:hypothetical protein
MKQSSTTVFVSSPSLSRLNSSGAEVVASYAAECTAAQPPQVQLIRRHHGARLSLEQFIVAGFADAWQATISQFMPDLLAVKARGQWQAALGVRTGQAEKLFVEQYLDADIRHVLQGVGVYTERTDIAEIGNLFSANRQFTLMLFVTMAHALYQCGIRHLVCCATSQVQHILSRHGLTLQVLAAGDPQRLQGNAADWGRYYESHPQVCHMDLASAVALIDADPRLQQLAQQQWPQLSALQQGFALEC